MRSPAEIAFRTVKRRTGKPIGTGESACKGVSDDEAGCAAPFRPQPFSRSLNRFIRKYGSGEKKGTQSAPDETQR